MLNFHEVTETLKNRFSESSLGKQLEKATLSDSDFKEVDRPIANIDPAGKKGVETGITLEREPLDPNEKDTSKVFNNISAGYGENNHRGLSVIKEDNPIKETDEGNEDIKDSENTEDKKDTENTENSEDTKDKNSDMTDDERKKLQEETGWSDEIIDAISSLKEAEIYKNAGLKEAEINGKKCLIRQDINPDQKDEFGRTNKERMAKGLPPITMSGETVELHHIGQKKDGPLAELTTQEHRGKGNDAILHDKQKESEIDRPEFAKERKQHWADRSENC